MNPEKLGIEPEDLKTLQKDKFTQVDADALSPHIEKADKSSVTIYEFCHIIQDPNQPGTIRIIRESLSEIVPHSSNKCIEDASNLGLSLDRQDYEEDLLQLVLKSAGLETLYTGKSIGQSTEPSNSSSLAKVDAITSFSSMDCKESKECIPKEAKDKTPSSDCSSCDLGCLESYKLQCPTTKGSKKSVIPDCVNSLSSQDLTNKCKCKASSSRDSIQSNKFPCDFEPPAVKAASNDSHNSKEETDHPEVTQKTFVEQHTETMSTIKNAFEDFIGKFYKSTQDAVTAVTSESAKQLAKSKISDIFSSTSENKTEDESKSSGSKKRFGIFERSDNHDTEEKTDILGSGSQAIGRILTKVDSTANRLRENISKSLENFPENIKNSYCNKSSPFDKPKPPSEVSHTILPESAEPTSNSFFSAIKSKIYSIFGETEVKINQSLSRKSSSVSSSSSASEEDDDDLIVNIVN